MPNVTINFGGATLSIPNAYFYGNVTQGFQPPLPTVPPLLFVGYFYGIQPKTPYTFLSAQDAINAVRGGPGGVYLTPISLPSPSVNGANFITLIDASENTTGSLTLSNSNPSGLISLSTTVWGPPANLIQASVSNGSVAGKQIEIYDGYTNKTYIGNNLGVPFQLAYTGNASSGVSYTVSGPAGAVTGFAVNSPNAGESFTISLGAATYPTVQSVVEYLNGTGFYSASVLSDTQGELNSQQLDPGSGTLTPAGTGSLVYANVASTLYDPIFWVNTFSQVVSATLYSSGVTTGALANIPLTSFTGAQGIPPTLSDYSEALNVGLNTPAWVVFIDSNGLGERALLAQHCETASETNNSAWRRGVTGSSVGDSVSTTIVNAQTLDSKQVGYVYPGIVVTNTSTGLNTTYGGLYAAAAAAGMLCGNAIAMPLTNKPLNGVNVEVNLTVSQLTELQNNGVMCLIQKNNVPTIMSDVSTWQVDNNPENVFLQQVGNLYWVGYSLISAAQPYIGGIAAPTTTKAIANAVKRCLNNLIYTDVGPGINANGVLSGWDATSLTVVYNGDTQQYQVSVNVQLVGQTRFITMTVFASPYNTSSAG